MDLANDERHKTLEVYLGLLVRREKGRRHLLLCRYDQPPLLLRSETFAASRAQCSARQLHPCQCTSAALRCTTVHCSA